VLLVNATAGPSPIHGTGLFAREALPAGTLVWALKPGFDVVLTRSQLDEISPVAGEQIRRFLYVDIETSAYVLCSDDAKYMNHSDTPNTRTLQDQTWTTRDVAAGEELTCDYREFDAVSRECCADRKTHR